MSLHYSKASSDSVGATTKTQDVKDVLVCRRKLENTALIYILWLNVCAQFHENRSSELNFE
jgi:hypothetical protein